MHVHENDAAVHQTPNATMTTYAAPSLGSTEHALWRVAMGPGASGPPHRIHGEQVWLILTGAADIDLEATHFHATAGDAVIFPADL